MRARRLTLLLLTISIQPGPLRAQTDRCLRRVITVSASDKQGQIIRGLSASDFQANFKGKPIKILSVAHNDKPVRVLIVLDRSRSMLEDESTWNGYLTAAMALVSHMPRSCMTGLTAFNDVILGSVPFTTDAAGLREAISGLSSVPKTLKKGGGSTALWDALVGAAESFDQPQPGDSLYALTDGDDNSSRMTRAATQKSLVNKGVRLFAFSIPAKGKPGDRWAIRDLEDMSRRTGGNVVAVSRKLVGTLAPLTDSSGTPTEETKWLELQFRQIFDFYRVEVELPLPVEKSQAWSLMMTNPKEQGIALMYAPELPACLLMPTTHN
jgi:hypothetical protein